MREIQAIELKSLSSSWGCVFQGLFKQFLLYWTITLDSYVQLQILRYPQIVFASIFIILSIR